MSGTIATQDANGSGDLLSFIERAARDPEFDVGKFEALLRMQREIVEQERREFNRAMAAAQTKMAPIVRDAVNTHTKSRYAKLETIDREIRPIYTEAGFSIRFGSAQSPRDGWLRIVCTVSHVSGYSETNYLDAPPDNSGTKGMTNKTPVQAVGSSVSYLRRYLTTMCFNIVLADDDDDGATTRTVTRNRPGNGAGKPPDPLDEPNAWQWVKNLDALLHGAQTRQDVLDLQGDARVVRVREREDTPEREKTRIDRMFDAAFAHLDDEAEAKIETPAPTSKGEDRRDQINREIPVDPPADWADPIAELIAEIETMDLVALNGLATSAPWRKRVREASEFPPDEDRVNEAITLRKAELSKGRS